MNAVSRALACIKANLLLMLSIGTAFGVYFDITRVYFVNDDFQHLATIVDRGGLYFLLQPWGGHLLLASNAAFYAMYELFGLRPEGFGWLVLLAHLLNVALFFRAASVLAGSKALGALGAALWGTSPLLAGALGWYSVFGQVLASTMFLIVLERIASLGHEPGIVPYRQALLWALLLLTGAACFGVGIGVAAVFPVVVVLLFPKLLQQRAVLAAFLPLPLLVLLVYMGARFLFTLIEPLPPGEVMLPSLALRSCPPILAMAGSLMTMSIFGLLRSFWVAPTVPDATWWIVGLFAGAVLAALAAGDGTARRRIVALLVLWMAMCGIIAVGRANFYASSGLQGVTRAARQTRYYYALTIPLAMLLPIVFNQAFRLARRPGLLAAAALTAGLGAGSWLYATSGWRVDEHLECRRYVTSVLREIDARIDAAPAHTDVRIPNLPVDTCVAGSGVGYGEFPGWAALFAIAYPDGRARGHRVRFIEPSDQQGVFDKSRSRVIGSLLVAQ